MSTNTAINTGGDRVTQALNTDSIDKVKDASQTRSLNTPLDRFIVAIARRFGGSRAKEVERFLKFAIVGVIGAIVDFGTLNLLQSTILPPVNAGGEDFRINVAIAVTIAFVAAVCSNFIWNRYWTYPDSRTRSIRRQLSQFAIVSFIGWMTRTLWITFSYGLIGSVAVNAFQVLSPTFEADAMFEARIGTNIAMFIGIFVVLIWNFFANRYWTYNDVD